MRINRRQITKGVIGSTVVGLTIPATTVAQRMMGTPAPMPGRGHQNMAGTGTSAAYMLITNNGDEADVLIGASTDVAEIAEIHEMVMDGDTMKMQELEDGLEIPAGETVSLERGGYHVMLININQDLNEGDEVTLTLEFEQAGEVELTVPVSINAPDDSEVKVGDLTIEDAHMRPAPMLGQPQQQHAQIAGSGTSAAFMHITNNGDETDKLIGGSSDVAEIVEIHEMVMDGDVMKMQELEDGLEIPAGETVILERGGYHVMLININQDLNEGDEVTLTLEFEIAGEVELTVPVTLTIPEDFSEEVGDLTIDGAHLRPAPMLSDSATPMEATPDSN